MTSGLKMEQSVVKGKDKENKVKKKG